MTDHQDGLLVEKNNVHKLVEAICFMIEHDKERQEYAEQAKIKSKYYCIDIIMKKWISLFESVIRK